MGNALRSSGIASAPPIHSHLLRPPLPSAHMGFREWMKSRNLRHGNHARTKPCRARLAENVASAACKGDKEFATFYLSPCYIFLARATSWRRTEPRIFAPAAATAGRYSAWRALGFGSVLIPVELARRWINLGSTLARLKSSCAL